MVKLKSISVEKFYNLKALICITLSIVTLLIAILSSFWVESPGYHRGLWKICMTLDNNGDSPEPQTLPNYASSPSVDFNGGCWSLASMNRIPGWWLVCLTLISGSMIFLIASIISFTIAMLRSATSSNYHLCSNVTMVALILSAISAACGLLIFPLELRKAVLTSMSTRRWEISWSYGLAWSSVIFSLGAILALYLDKRTSKAMKNGHGPDHIYYYNDKEASNSSVCISRDNVQV